MCVTRPAQVCSLSHKALHKECLQLLVIRTRPGGVLEDIPGSTTANSPEELTDSSQTLRQPGASRVKTDHFHPYPAWPSSSSDQGDLPCPAKHFSVAEQPHISRSSLSLDSSAPVSCHTQHPPGLFLHVVPVNPRQQICHIPDAHHSLTLRVMCGHRA